MRFRPHFVLSKFRSLVSDARVSRVSEEDLLDLERAQHAHFHAVGLDWDKSKAITASLFEKNGQAREDLSCHYEVFAGISAVSQPQRILEIGTHKGRFTEYLSLLFPNAHIDTWELKATVGEVKPNDLLVAYGDHSIERQRRLQKCGNVTQILGDSVSLTKSVNTYDVIWVDGDHAFPGVAIDLTNALRLVSENGWVCVDDVRGRDATSSEFGGQECALVVEHFCNRGLATSGRVIKRLRPGETLLTIEERKYVAVMRPALNWQDA